MMEYRHYHVVLAYPALGTVAVRHIICQDLPVSIVKIRIRLRLLKHERQTGERKILCGLFHTLPEAQAKRDIVARSIPRTQLVLTYPPQGDTLP